MLFRMLNSKVLHQNLKKNVNNISFATTLNKDTDQIIKKNIKIKMENTPSDYINGIFQERNTFLSQHQPKNLPILLSNSSISRNQSIPNAFFKCNDKRCKICRLYIIGCSEFELANKKYGT